MLPYDLAPSVVPAEEPQPVRRLVTGSRPRIVIVRVVLQELSADRSERRQLLRCEYDDLREVEHVEPRAPAQVAVPRRRDSLRHIPPSYGHDRYNRLIFSGLSLSNLASVSVSARR